MKTLIKRMLIVVIATVSALALSIMVGAAPPPKSDALPDAIIFDTLPKEPQGFALSPAAPDDTITIFLPDIVWRIGVMTDGLYALDYTTLIAAGVPVTAAFPADFHLLWRGREVALHAVGTEDDSFDPGDALRFYGEKFYGSRQDERYTDENVYWLTLDATKPGLRMATRDVQPDTAGASGICTGTTLAEQNNRYWARGSNNPGTATVWFWDEVNTTSTVTRTYPITLSAPLTTSSGAVLTAELASYNENTAVNPDHHIRLTLNNTALGDFTWDGKMGHIITTRVPAASLLDGENTLHVAYVADASHQRVYFDRATLTYRRLPEAKGNTIQCTATRDITTTYTFTGLLANTPLYDISNALHPLVLTGAVTNPGGLTFTDNVPEGTRYIAETIRPITPTRYYPATDLISPTIGADEIIIAPKHFLDALQPLVDHRTNQGLRVRAVAVEDIYPLFNSGIFHPEAIRAFVAHAYNNWPGMPVQYLFLVGDGNFNLKTYNPDIYGNAPTWIPPYLEFADPIQGDVPIDVRFGDVNNDGLSEVAVGRIPAQTVTEVAGYVAKVLTYETHPPAAWQSKALLIADNGQGEDEGFDSLLNRLAQTYIPNGIQVQRIYMEDYCTGYAPCPDVTHAVTEAWNTGATLLTYAGHGSIHRWAHEPLLLNTQLTQLNETTSLPFLLALDCWDGYWMFPPKYHALPRKDVRSISEWATTVLTQTGAIAAFGPAGYAFANQQESLANAMYSSLFVDGERHIGALTQIGREAISTTYMARTYTLLGDPALELKILILDQYVFLPLIIRGE